MQPACMRSVSFLGKFTSGSRIRASRSDLLKLPTYFTRATRSPPPLPPFPPSLARTPACLPTDLNSRLQSSSHLSPDALHLLDSLSLSLAPTRPCLPTDRPNDATTTSLLAPSEASSSFPTCFTCLTQASTIPTLAHPQVSVPTVRLQSPFCHFTSPPTSSALTGISTSLRVFLVCFRPSSPFPNFKPHSSHTGSPTAPQLPIPAAVFTDHPSSAFCSCFLSRFERGFAVGFQPSRVTGLQATVHRTYP